MRSLLFFALAVIIGPGPLRAAPNSFAVRDVRVFDGTNVLRDANVVIQNGRVVAVGTAVRIAPGLRVIPGVGKTLLPGLIDAHVHVFPGAQHDALRFGVSTVLDMFNLTHEFAKWRAQRESLEPTAEADTWS